MLTDKVRVGLGDCAALVCAWRVHNKAHVGKGSTSTQGHRVARHFVAGDGEDVVDINKI